MDQPRPLLSLCMMGRDDDYMPDFRYRLVTTVDFIARQLARLGALDQVEIVVTDWASDTPMSKTLVFSPDGARICRFLYLSPEALRQAGANAAVPHPASGTNAAIRRAVGEFILQIGADTLLPSHALGSLLTLCRGGVDLPAERTEALLLIPRAQVPWQFVKRQPPPAEWERYLQVNSCYLPVDVPYDLNAGGSAGAILMHRGLWQRFRGLSEALAGWGWSDCELASRVCQEHPWMALAGLGVVAFHMEHEPNAGRRSEGPAVRLNAWDRTYPYTTQAVTNDTEWGFGRIDLPSVGAQAAEAGEAAADADGAACLPGMDWAGFPHELQDSKVLAIMARALGKLVEKRLVGSECLAERTALALLGWYAAHRYPRRFLDVGIRQPGPSAVVAALCPSVAIYGIGRWDGNLAYPETTSALAVGLALAGHRGHMQFLNGDPRTGVARIATLMPDSRSIDLVYVCEPCLGSAFLDLAVEAFALLAPGGALVFRAASRESAHRLWQQLRQQPGLSAVFHASDVFTGMAFAAVDGEPRASAEPVELSDAGERLAWSEVSPALVWQLARACRNLDRPDRFVRRALRCFFKTGFTTPRT